VTSELDHTADPSLEQGSLTLERHLIARAGWTIVLSGVLATALGTWGWWSTWPGDAIVEPVLVILALGAMALLWTVAEPSVAWLSRSIFGLAAATALLAQGVMINGRAFYSTDAAAFNDAAARLLRQGLNPYTHSLAPISARHLDGVANYWTYSLDGGHVAKLSYPAGSFLFQVPLQILGTHHLPADWLDLFAGLAAAVLMFVMLPVAIRWLAPSVLLFGLYIGVFANGGTDALFVPFLLIALWRWDRFSDLKVSRLARWAGPVALGLACTIKQTPWFCVPFLLAGVAFEAASADSSPLKATGRYAGLVAGVFLLVNVPFIIWSPGAWLHGTLLPLTDPLVPDGQGLVTLALHGTVHGVRVLPLAIAGLLAELALLASYALYYRRMKHLWLFLLPLVLTIPARSLSEYLIDFLPAAIIAAVSVRPTTYVPLAFVQRGWRRVAPLAAGVGAVGFVIAAFMSPVLTITVDSFTTAHEFRYFTSMTVTVHNNTAAPVTASLATLENNTHPTGFWRLGAKDSVVINPNQSRTVVLHAPPFTTTSLRGQWWLVEGVTPSPAAVSTSSPMKWRLGPYPLRFKS